MTPLAEVLALMHDAGKGLRSLSTTRREWSDDARQRFLLERPQRQAETGGQAVYLGETSRRFERVERWWATGGSFRCDATISFPEGERHELHGGNADVRWSENRAPVLSARSR